MNPFILVLLLASDILANSYGQPELTVRVHPSPQDTPQISVRVIEPPVIQGIPQNEPFHVTIPILSSDLDTPADNLGFKTDEMDSNSGLSDSNRYLDDEWPSIQPTGDEDEIFGTTVPSPHPSAVRFESYSAPDLQPAISSQTLPEEPSSPIVRFEY